MKTLANFASFLTRFFTQQLMQQANVSPHTIASYRDSFRLLLRFANIRLKKTPSKLSIEDLDAPLIHDFLKYLEKDRGITARSRNLRLTAIRSFFKFISYELPEHSAQIQRILAIPTKRCTHAQVNYLRRTEVEALLASPDRNDWSGRRDHAWILLAIQTGVRVSELTGLTRQDVSLETGAHIHVLGKGRKERCTPLTQEAVSVLKAWMKEIASNDEQVLFPGQHDGRLSSDGIQYLLKKHLIIACQNCPSLQDKRVSPHVLRHTCAMELLQAGIDTSVIALWLGHESVETTQVYLHADLAMKEKIMSKIQPHDEHPARYQPDDGLLAFLKSL
jgi:site-specific recombinase XerD